MLVGSSQGGMNIEDVAKDNPSAILKSAVDIASGLSKEQTIKLAADMGFSDQCVDEVSHSKLMRVCF